jgi:transglutaminase-like putative cysteine protease
MRSLFRFVLVMGLLGGVGYALYLYQPAVRQRVDTWIGRADSLVHPRGGAGPQAPARDYARLPERRHDYTRLDFAAIDAHALATPPEKETDIATLASHLTRPAKRQIEKARALFRWVTDRVRYNDHGFNTKNYGSPDPLDVLKTRKAVCEGYAKLFNALAESVGIPAKMLTGRAKGYGYSPGDGHGEPDHAWSVLQIDGQWRLFDPTWGSGSGKNVGGKLKTTQRFEERWFDTDPTAFVFKHLPAEQDWQLLRQPLSQEEFEAMPEIGPRFFDLGFVPDTVLAGLRRAEIAQLPVLFEHPFDVRNLDAPLANPITANEEVCMQFECPNCTKVAALNNQKWFYFDKSGDTFTGLFSPKPGRLVLVAQLPKVKERFDGILDYQVKRGAALRHSK